MITRRDQQPGEKLTNFLGDLQILALKAYPRESNEIRDHLIQRRFFKNIESLQVRLGLKKNLGDADKTLDNALERTLHIEVVTRFEEEDNKPRVYAMQLNKTTQQVIRLKIYCEHCRLTNLTGKIIKSFHPKERGQKSFCAEVREIQEKPEIEIETIKAITEAQLMIDEQLRQ